MAGLLEGIRVLDFTGSVSGPACSMFLADAGAEVIKIERPGRGDDSRMFPPFKEGWSGSYVTLQRGKKGIALNMKESEGVQIFRELVKISDVVVENMTQGTMTICGPTLKFPETPLRVQGPAPGLGQHTREVLRDLLGYDDERLDRLEERGIIAGG